jgi:hypothetical protein
MPRSNVRSRVASHREQLRARGLRPVQIWVPDTRAPGFAEEARRQSASVDAGDEFGEVMDFIERVSVFDEDDADDHPPDAPR